MSSPAVSIIIPVYNAERHLQRCLDSVMSQSCTDFELLLVDDGSTDSSGAICDGYAARDARVHVIHKPNSGVSDSRNLAMEQASGIYLQFLDSDDWITPDATKLLLATAQRQRCDLVIADFYRVVGERLSRKGSIDRMDVLTREEYASYMMKSPADFYYGVLWNKLYRREIVEQHHLRMNTDLTWCEDFMFNLEYILHSETFCALPVPIYYYVKVKGSLSSQGGNLANAIAMKRILFEYYNQFYKHVFDEETYEKNRLRVYRFLIDAARDGAVPPPLLPSSQKLGDERIHVRPEALAGQGPLHDLFLLRKLLERSLETAALKHDLTLQEVWLLLHLQQFGPILTRRELSDFAHLSRSALSLTLQRLTAKGIISVEELRSPHHGEKRLYFSFSPLGETLLSDLSAAQEDCSAACLSLLSEEERPQAAALLDKIFQGVREALR